MQPLFAYLLAANAKPFRAGTHDCALFAAGWVREVTGQDLARGWRGKYRSLKRGAEVLAEAGFDSHVALAAAHLPEIAPAFALPGDLMILDDDACGILIGERVAVLSPGGVGYVSRLDARRAFAVRAG